MQIAELQLQHPAVTLAPVLSLWLTTNMPGRQGHIRLVICARLVKHNLQVGVVKLLRSLCVEASGILPIIITTL